MRNLVRRIIIFLFNLIADIEIQDVQNVPAQGSFVIATNHIGIIDIAMFH